MRRVVRRVVRPALWALWLVGLSALQACATPEAGAPPPAVVWADARFAAPEAGVLAPAALLSADAPMRQYLAGHPRLGPRGLGDAVPLAQRLVQALSTPGELQLLYDERPPTRAAAEAFAERRGNCLSLVLMTAALARELGLRVEFNQVGTLALWRHEGDIALRSHHVNLSLESPMQRQLRGYASGAAWLVDFVPGQDLRRLPLQPISLARVQAMYYNNRAAELLAEGALAAAYWHLRQGLALDAAHDDSRNTLGVLYLRAGLLDQADATLAQVLQRVPTQTSALTNLALVREAQGRPDEARALRARRDALGDDRPPAARAAGEPHRHASPA